MLDNPDVIYISHIHPDHYDPIFLKKYLKNLLKKKGFNLKIKEQLFVA